MRTKQEEWVQLTDKARWYELPQRSVNWGQIGGLTTASLGLLVMFVQFFASANPYSVIFWWGVTGFFIGAGVFAWFERSAVVRLSWRPKREYLLESRGKTHRCIHLEGDLPTHTHDARRGQCHYYEKVFQHAPLCIYCEAYSPLGSLAPETLANSPGGLAEPTFAEPMPQQAKPAA